MGGDEFLIIGHARKINDAEAFAEKIRAAIASLEYNVGNRYSGKPRVVSSGRAERVQAYVMGRTDAEEEK